MAEKKTRSIAGHFRKKSATIKSKSQKSLLWFFNQAIIVQK
jgi:hypothetical protein